MTRSAPRCPDELRITRALSSGGDADLRAHVAECERCGELHADLTHLIDLARRMPATQLAEERVEQLRTELLVRAGTAAKPARGTKVAAARWAAVAAVSAAIAASLALWIEMPGAPPSAQRADKVSQASVYRGTQVASTAARFMRLGSQPDEIVRLMDGELHVEVASLRSGERFRVLTLDAEVEVRGTAFDVVAEHDHLVSVRVQHGRVEVRPAEGPAVSLQAGESWQSAGSSPPATAVVPSAPAVARPPVLVPRSPRPRPVLSVAVDPSALANGKSAAEAAFREGWAELRNGRQLEALAAFERAMALQPQSPFAEDAAFWRAVTLERSGQRAGAELALDDFVTRHRASARVGEASAMLGWMLLERGHLEQARTRFLAARDDRAQRIAASARAGLAELSRHKH